MTPLTVSPKNILAIASNVDRCEASLLKKFSEMGIEVTLIGDPIQRYQEDLGNKIKNIPCEFKSRFQLSAVKVIKEQLKIIKPEIVHVFSARALSNTLIASAGRKINLVAYRGTMGHLSWLDPSSWLSFLNPKIKKIICVSNAVEGYLLGQKVPRHRVTTIHKGHQFSWYQIPTALRRTDFNIPENALVIGCVANVRPVKGVDFLIKAFSLLKEEKGLDTKLIYLLLVGDLGSDYIRALIKSSPLSDQIITTGFRKDATDIVGLSDIFVMPSIAREGLPKALIEAMAKGIAPIVTDVGGMPEVVLKDQHGLVIEPSNENVLKDAIVKLLTSKETRNTFSERSQQRIKDDFSLDKTVQKTLDVYRSIL